MTRKLFSTLVLALFACMVTTIAQEETQENPYKDNLGIYKYKKSQGEFGIHGGHYFFAGDVDPEFGWAAGLHYRHALDYAVSLRLDLFYGQARGIEAEVVPQSIMPDFIQAGGYTDNRPWYPNFETNVLSGSVQVLYSLNAHNFNQQLKKWNIYFIGGVGYHQANVNIDLLDGSNNPYDFSGVNTTADKKDRKKEIADILDRDYDLEVPILEDDNITAFHANIGLGASRRLGKNASLSLEHQVILPFGRKTDFYDGYDFSDIGGINYELMNYTSLRLGFDIGNTKNGDRLDPLWWVGPSDLIADDLAGVMQRVDESLRDSDGDGVLDMVDEDPNTPEGATVDTRGNLLDSDRDGVSDYQDKEPHSPPGYPVDADGIAQVPDPGYTTEDDVNRIVDAKLEEFSNTFNSGHAWFLPMINFAFDYYTIRPSEYSKLHAIATVLEQNPDLKLVAYGNTDRPGSECYNNLLAYNRVESAINYLVAHYGISADRFIKKVVGEEDLLVDTNSRSLLNRRVEFMVAKDTMSSDSKPECGVRSAGKGRKEYKGNKAGF